MVRLARRLAVIDWADLRTGWARRSALIMDNAGAPRWLIRLRCPVRPDWGAVLEELTQRIKGG